jgi:hypothetical protein
MKHPERIASARLFRSFRLPVGSKSAIPSALAAAGSKHPTGRPLSCGLHLTDTQSAISQSPGASHQHSSDQYDLNLQTAGKAEDPT